MRKKKMKKRENSLGRGLISKRRFVEIAVVLCSMFLVALPSTVIATEQDDYVLGIYGNANEDDTIDMRDLTYVKLIFFGKKPETELADAKYDGKINPLDFIQIKLIIVGKEKELTLGTFTIHEKAKVVTVHKPVKRIVILPISSGEAIRCVKAKNKVVGIGTGLTKEASKVFFPELSKLPTVGKWSNPDCEAILSRNPDIVIADVRWPSPDKLEDLLKGSGITVVRMGFTYPDFAIAEMEMLGYILDKREEAEEFIAFEKECIDHIKNRVDELSEDEKPRVYPMYSIWKPGSDGSIVHMLCVMAGGINIAADLKGGTGGMYPTVDPEWVIEQNPEIMFKWSSPGGYNVEDTSKMKELWEEIVNRPELANVAAIKEEKVFLLTTDITSRPKYFVSFAYLAKWFHPELFDDLDPEAIHKEYLERFQGMPYQGVYVYPPLAS
jgi:iron complex transport system substrate-binding protein